MRRKSGRPSKQTLATADHLRVIHEYGDREDGYLDCGIETVNGSDVLMAFWDGNHARGKGGTAQVVQYAKSIGKPVLIIDAETGALRRENWGKLESGDAILQDLNALPEAPAAVGVNPFGAPETVLRFQQKCDFHATQGAPHFRRLIVATVMSHVMATLIATATVAYALHMLALPWAKLCSSPSAWWRRSRCAGTCARITAGCAAAWRRNSAARRWPPGGCPAPRRCCRTWTWWARGA